MTPIDIGAWPHELPPFWREPALPIARGNARVSQGERKLGKAALQSHIVVVNILARITIDPEQCGGKPCIRSMRIRVKDVLEMLGSGMTELEILTEFPYLEADDLRAAQLYAARLTDHPVLHSA